MFDVTWTLEGADLIWSRLSSVRNDVKKKGGRFALKKASNFIRDKVIKSALRLDDPESAEKIYKNVSVRWNRLLYRRTGDLGFRVGILGGAKSYGNTKANRRLKRVGLKYKVGGDSKNPGGDTFYWRFVEFGTKKMQARPFMRPVLETQGVEASRVFIENYKKALDRAIARAQR